MVPPGTSNRAVVLASGGMDSTVTAALARDRETKRLLAGLLLAALDATTLLAQERPKVLAVPRQYREVNLWLALERGVGLAAGLPQQLRLGRFIRTDDDTNQGNAPGGAYDART